MANHSTMQVAINLGSLYKALYHEVPVTQENSKAVRAAALATLANVLISDYLNCWNEAGEGVAAAAKKLLKEAKEAADKALDVDPELVLAHYARGLVHRAEKERVQALEAFDNAIRNDTGFARAYAQKGSELINDGRFDEAHKDIDHAILIGSDDASLGMFYWNRGRAHFLNENPDYPKAIEALKEAVRLRPNLWHNWLYLISAYAHKEGEPYATAKKWLRKFKTESPFKGTPFTIAKVRSYEKANQIDNHKVKDGRDRFREGLKWAGMK